MRGLHIARFLRLLGIAVLAVPVCKPAAPAKAGALAPAGAAGVVVESVTPRSAAAAAGLRASDVILSWSCAASLPALPEAAEGRVRSSYDLDLLEVGESPRRPVTLRGRRGEKEMAWSLGASEWGLATRPGLSGELAALYARATAEVEAGDLDAAGRSWRAAAETARNSGEGRLAAWFLQRLARALGYALLWPRADAAYEEAVAILERTNDLPAAAYLLRVWGDAFVVRGAWDAAAERFRKALELDRTRNPEGLAAAASLDALGLATAKQGDYAAAEELVRQGLAIREEQTPATAEVARSLNRLGILARWRGDLSAAAEYLARGEELQRRLNPESTLHALLLMNLGNVADDSGDLDRAESFHRRALGIFERTDRDSGYVAGALQNLVNVAIQRGDLAQTDELLGRILARPSGRQPDESEIWRALVSLGHLASLRGEVETAKVHYERAAALAEKLFPQGRDLGLTLAGLGEVALSQGDFATARSALERARAIGERLAPGSVDVADRLHGLARLETAAGDSARAEAHLRRALEILAEAAPESLQASSVLGDLGELALRRGRVEDARSFHRRALSLRSRLAPESTEEAEALHRLGRTEMRAGRSREGIDHLCRAIDVLDRQRVRLGGTPEARTAFEATLGEHYLACLEGLVESDRATEAFHVLERGRARSFLSLLAERNLRLSELPPALAAERRRVNARYDGVQAQLAVLSAGRDDAEIARLTGELRDLRHRQEEIFARILRESPRAAALENPEPLTLAGARAALDPGTVLLEYAVGRERSWLFVVQPAGAGGSGLSVFRITAGAETLREEVESFRLRLKDPGSSVEELRAPARRLYDLLVRPAEPRIARARRALLSADGPLHTLAFAALMRDDRFLVEWKPIHSVLSATVYAELAKSRPSPGSPGTDRLTAFGDPVYPFAEAAADPEVREAVRRGLALQPLPASGREVKSIAGLYPGARVFLGSDATEERAKSLGAESRLVHFACHGVIDERFPLNSALVLTVPEKPAEGQDNGLLQAWEIFESVRLNADLVTLSACDTALGREMAGEGLVGLTRAFQHAGARAVLATLWGVSDLSTAGFMERFYGHLRGGKPKDEALRAAQVERIRERDGFSHPFHWAAFQLTGDWR